MRNTYWVVRVHNLKLEPLAISIITDELPTNKKRKDIENTITISDPTDLDNLQYSCELSG